LIGLEGYGAALAKAMVGSGFAEDLFVWDSDQIQMDDLCNFSDELKPFNRHDLQQDIGIWILNESISKMDSWLDYLAKNVVEGALVVDILPAKCLFEPKLSPKLQEHWIGLFPLQGMTSGSNSESTIWLLSSKNFDRVPLRRAEMLVHSLDGRPAQVTPAQSDTIVAWTHLAPQLYRNHYEKSMQKALNPIASDIVSSTDWISQYFESEFGAELTHLKSLIPTQIDLD